MGGMSDLMIEQDNERIDKWIRERLGDENIDEESDEYRELADEYYFLQEHLREQYEFEEDLKWLKENDSSAIHRYFFGELEELERLVKKNISIDKPYLIYRMTYAHAVTLLEVFLSDTVKSLVNEKLTYFENARKIDELKNAKYSLDFLAKNESNPRNIAIKELSKILYHNIPKVKRMLEIILGQRVDIDISKLSKITNIRHDIVHRNGKTTEGNPIYLDQSDLLEMIGEIKIFAKELQKKIIQQD
ncbi:HEPN domain-containing protein [Oceanicoccus sp. KOV_DT_Chl]|uniref:HEPN domain-containing protein n=1 Tax=Oceanicoccus sp. KOV_DT_Chl TaxID=1904639 RepID=UPI000C7AE793|nr:HEPN domain-containing protein [Oceanicoccus sp. KOV_DT_Chl]